MHYPKEVVRPGKKNNVLQKWFPLEKDTYCPKSWAEKNLGKNNFFQLS